MYEGITRADGLNIAQPNLFDDINVYARSLLVDSGVDVWNEDLGKTPQEQEQIYTAISATFIRYLEMDFFIEKLQHDPFKKKTKATDKDKKEILSKLDKYNQPFYIENEDKTFIRPYNSFDCIQIAM